MLVLCCIRSKSSKQKLNLEYEYVSETTQLIVYTNTFHNSNCASFNSLFFFCGTQSWNSTMDRHRTRSTKSHRRFTDVLPQFSQKSVHYTDTMTHRYEMHQI